MTLHGFLHRHCWGLCLAYIKAQGTEHAVPTADKALLWHSSHYDTALALRAAPRFSGALYACSILNIRLLLAYTTDIRPCL